MTLEEKSGDHQRQRDPSSRDHECLYTISRKHQMKIHFTKAQYSFRVSCAVFPPMAAIHSFCFMAMSIFFLQANIESYFFGLTVCQTVSCEFSVGEDLDSCVFHQFAMSQEVMTCLPLLAGRICSQTVCFLSVRYVGVHQSKAVVTQSFQTFSLCLF